MSQEIYYTSAAEGLKPNTRGFCTVAATDGLPKPLWDRLESLSAFRHHFPSGSGQPNPVAHAHWIVTLAGREYHALSRVADAGMDYTQRTNAFAHHLVLDPEELAPAGPAWMLRQPGIMQTAWDGRVGSITRSSPLPMGSAGPAPCVAWAQIAGDAGYAGLLAESAAKNPHRPVCILFSPGMDLLPLIDEVLRLLPPPVRWQVTFNTYFTSAPTTVLGAWRCCLAGTPAAEQGRRYAASGLLLDLTGGKVPPLVETPWTALARSGQPVSPAAPKATLSKLPPVAPPPIVKPSGPKPDWTSRPAGGQAASSPSAPVSPSSEEPLELAPAASTTPAGPRFSEEDLRAYNDLIAQAEARAAAQKDPASSGSGYRAAGLLQVDAPTKGERQRAGDASTSKASLVAVGILVAAALGVVILLAVMMLRPNKEPIAEPTPPPRAPVAIVPQTKPAATEVVSIHPQTKPADPVIVKSPDKPAPPPPPVLVVLKSALEWPKDLTALTPAPQTIPLSKDVEHLDKLTSLQLLFANQQSQTTILVGGKDATLVVSPLLGKPGAALKWKQGIASAATLATVELKPRDGRLEVAWTLSEVQNSPDAALAAYWLLSSATMVVTDAAGTRPQPIEFKPLVIDNLSLTDAASDIVWVVQPPPGAVLVQKSALPQGWQSAWIPGWDSRDGPPTPDKAFSILRYKKPIEGADDAAFELIFRDRLAHVECNLVQRQRQTEHDLADLESQIKDQESRVKLGADSQILDDKKKSAQACRAAIDAYRDIKSLDIEVMMPDKTTIATMKFER